MIFDVEFVLREFLPRKSQKAEKRIIINGNKKLSYLKWEIHNYLPGQKPQQ